MHNHFPHPSGNSGARHHGDFMRHGFKHPFPMGGFPQGFAGPMGQRARRGDVRTAIMRLIAKQPMHGYQIIQELSARSGGAWSPSAGSVYPTLQLLADEGLIVAEETGGKKVFSLTESGIAAEAELAGQPAPWEEVASGDTGRAGYREAVGKLMQVAFQVGTSGSSDQTKAAIEILTDARKKLYAILAED